MSLPKLTVMKHKMTLPSTGESITFRPFLVKEEKLLMMAMQTGEQDDMVRALKEIINNCVEKQMNLDSLPILQTALHYLVTVVVRLIFLWLHELARLAQCLLELMCR